MLRQLALGAAIPWCSGRLGKVTLGGGNKSGLFQVGRGGVGWEGRLQPLHQLTPGGHGRCDIL